MKAQSYGNIKKYAHKTKHSSCSESAGLNSVSCIKEEFTNHTPYAINQTNMWINI